MFNASKWVLSCGRYSLFCNISNPRVNFTLQAKVICSYWQCSLSFHSHQMKWCNLSHMYKIYMTMHHYTVKLKQGGSCLWRLNASYTHIYSWQQEWKCTSSWNAQKLEWREQSTSDSCHMISGSTAQQIMITRCSEPVNVNFGSESTELATGSHLGTCALNLICQMVCMKVQKNT